MLKLIGIAVAVIGLILLAATIVSGRRNGIADAARELDMITESGYAGTHEEAKMGARIKEAPLADTPIKAAPKKRALSQEAKDILAMVEKEKEEERSAAGQKKAAERKKPGRLEDRRSREKGGGTDILDRKARSTQDRTDVMKPKSNKAGDTDILGRKSGSGDTDILRKKPEESGTDILERKPDRSGKSGQHTDILKRHKPASTGGDTDILGKQDHEERDRSDSTDILKRAPARESKTDILRRPDEEGGSTDILERRDK